MSGINKQRALHGVADLSRLKNNKRKKLDKLFRDYDTDRTSYSSRVLDKKETQAKDLRLEDGELYSALSQHSKLLADRYKNKSYKYLDTYKKEQYLNTMASKPEIKEVLNKMCNELVVTHEDETKFAKPRILDLELKELGFADAVIEAITKNLNRNFNDFYKKLGLSRDGAWNKMYEFLKKGKLAYEVVYDNVENPKKILHFVEIDHNSLEEFYDEGQRFWKFTPKRVTDVEYGYMGTTMGTMINESVLLYDHQVIMVDWNKGMIDSEHDSYLEQLIKPYNFMRIIDETRIIWAVTNSTFRTLYNIPTANQGRNRSEQTVSNAMEMYKDHYNLDTYSGDISINGENNLPFSKDHFLSKGDSGDPEITVLGGEGHALQDMTPNEMFQKKFYRASGIPFGRFDSGSQETWNLDPTSIYREEIDFSRTVAKIRNIFSNILLKPMLYQLVMDMPDLHDEPDVPENITLEYTSYNIFGRLMNQEIMKVEMEFVEQMRSSANIETADGTSIPLFPLKFILKEYLGYDEERIKLLKEMQLEEIEENLMLEKRVVDIRNKYGLKDEFIDEPEF